MMQLIVISILRKRCGNRLREFLSVHEMTNESFDSSDPTLSRVFIGWLKEKFKLLNLNNKAKLEIGMQIATLRFFFKRNRWKMQFKYSLGVISLCSALFLVGCNDDNSSVSQTPTVQEQNRNYSRLLFRVLYP